MAQSLTSSSALRNKIVACIVVIITLFITLKYYSNTLAFHPSDTVVICAVARNSRFLIREWMLYHQAIGVTHFYIYDNNLPHEDNLTHVLLPMPSHLYTIILSHDKFSWDGQIKMYSDCRNRFGYLHNWILQIDMDEMLVLKNEASLLSYLKAYSGYAEISFYWFATCTSHFSRRPVSVICDTVPFNVTPWLDEFKSMYRPNFIFGNHHAHFVSQIDYFRAFAPLDEAVIYHFYTRSLQDYVLNKFVSSSTVRSDFNAWKLYLHFLEACNGDASVTESCCLARTNDVVCHHLQSMNAQYPISGMTPTFTVLSEFSTLVDNPSYRYAKEIILQNKPVTKHHLQALLRLSSNVSVVSGT